MSYWQLGVPAADQVIHGWANTRVMLMLSVEYCKNIKFKYETLRSKDEKIMRIQMRITGPAWPGVTTRDEGYKYLRALCIFHSESQQWHSQGLTWHSSGHSDVSLTLTPGTGSLLWVPQSHSHYPRIWDMFGVITWDFPPLMYSFEMSPLCLRVMPDVDTSPGWLGCIKSHHDIIMSVYLQM